MRNRKCGDAILNLENIPVHIYRYISRKSSDIPVHVPLEWRNVQQWWVPCEILNKIPEPCYQNPGSSPSMTHFIIGVYIKDWHFISNLNGLFNLAQQQSQCGISCSKLKQSEIEYCVFIEHCVIESVLVSCSMSRFFFAQRNLFSLYYEHTPYNHVLFNRVCSVSKGISLFLPCWHWYTQINNTTHNQRMIYLMGTCMANFPVWNSKPTPGNCIRGNMPLGYGDIDSCVPGRKEVLIEWLSLGLEKFQSMFPVPALFQFPCAGIGLMLDHPGMLPQFEIFVLLIALWWDHYYTVKPVTKGLVKVYVTITFICAPCLF